jgi:NADH dehydrogenase
MKVEEGRMTAAAKPWMTEHRTPRVVIIGGGFGGLYAARALKRDDVEVTVLDRTNHHVFQPLLYQVATATLTPADIAAPIRWLLRKQRHTTVIMTEVTDIDVERRTVTTSSAGELPYDFLVVASGARHAYFGHPEWEAVAPGLKSIDDAVEIRQRILAAFERAEASTDPAERAALLTFVVVGAGPTGVELAGMIATMAHHGMVEEFRRSDPSRARVLLLEGGPRVLSTYPPALGERARRDLIALGVEVRTGALVTAVTADAVQVGTETIPTRTVIWAAGNAASPLGRMLGAPLDRSGRVQVAPDLSVPGHEELFVIGDLAAIASDGKPVPAVAPAAMQMGRHAAHNIRRTLEQRDRLPFRYRNKGDLATIGRYRAIADFGRFTVSGVLAWWLWLLLHIMYLAGFRNRLSVLVEWAYSYFTYGRGSRLITGRGHERAASSTPALEPKW